MATNETRLCRKGHEMTPYGTQGRWKCWTCERERHAAPERRAKKREHMRQYNRTPERREYMRERFATNPKYRAKIKAHKVKRKRLMEGADAEIFSFEEIFIRDDWVCGLCGEPTNPEVEYPHPHSPTLDHRLPLSRGGAHTRENTMCAHWQCNLAKHAKTFEEWCEYRGVTVQSDIAI